MHRGDVSELVERCGQLPLAIRIAGARLRHRPAWTVGHLNARLAAQDRRLSELAVDGRRLGVDLRLVVRVAWIPNSNACSGSSA